MGFDEENLEPMPRKLKIKLEQTNPAVKSSFLIISENGKRQICASSVDELKKNIAEKFNFNCMNEEVLIEFWSDTFEDWILLDDQLPKNNSKIQLKIITKLVI